MKNSFSSPYRLLVVDYDPPPSPPPLCEERGSCAYIRLFCCSFVRFQVCSAFFAKDVAAPERHPYVVCAASSATFVILFYQDHSGGRRYLPPCPPALPCVVRLPTFTVVSNEIVQTISKGYLSLQYPYSSVTSRLFFLHPPGYGRTGVP